MSTFGWRRPAKAEISGINSPAEKPSGLKPPNPVPLPARNIFQDITNAPTKVAQPRKPREGSKAKLSPRSPSSRRKTSSPRQANPRGGAKPKLELLKSKMKVKENNRRESLKRSRGGEQVSSPSLSSPSTNSSVVSAAISSAPPASGFKSLDPTVISPDQDVFNMPNPNHKPLLSQVESPGGCLNYRHKLVRSFSEPLGLETGIGAPFKNTLGEMKEEDDENMYAISNLAAQANRGELDDEGKPIADFFKNCPQPAGGLSGKHQRSSRRQLNMNDAAIHVGVPSPEAFVAPSPCSLPSLPSSGAEEGKSSSPAKEAEEDGFLKRRQPELSVGPGGLGEEDDKTDEEVGTDEEDSNKTVDITTLVERSKSLVRSRSMSSIGSMSQLQAGVSMVLVKENSENRITELCSSADLTIGLSSVSSSQTTTNFASGSFAPGSFAAFRTQNSGESLQTPDKSASPIICRRKRSKRMHGYSSSTLSCSLSANLSSSSLNSPFSNMPQENVCRPPQRSQSPNISRAAGLSVSPAFSPNLGRLSCETNVSTSRSANSGGGFFFGNNFGLSTSSSTELSRTSTWNHSSQAWAASPNSRSGPAHSPISPTVSATANKLGGMSLATQPNTPVTGGLSELDTESADAPFGMLPPPRNAASSPIMLGRPSVFARRAAIAASTVAQSEPNANFWRKSASSVPGNVDENHFSHSTSGVAGVAQSSNSPHDFALPTLPGSSPFKKISVDTVSRLLNGEFEQQLSEFVIIDCRYKYEYDGGHIEGAVNFNKRSDITKFFMANQEQDCSRIAIIFHCEYSKHRGPQSMKYLRDLDRTQNTYRYPHLSFPEIYLMKGGYKEFFSSHKTLCTPESYVSMWDPNYEGELRRETQRNRKSWKAKSCRGRVSRKRRMRTRDQGRRAETSENPALPALTRTLSACLPADVTRSSSF